VNPKYPAHLLQAIWVLCLIVYLRFWLGLVVHITGVVNKSRRKKA